MAAPSPYRTRPSRLRRLFRSVIALLALLGLLMVVVTFSPLVSWWAGKLGDPWLNPPGDVLIVLSGSNLGDGTIGLNSYWRAVYAARAYRSQHFREILVSGAAAAVPMRDFLVSQGVPAAIIRTEEASASTRESALDVARMVGGTPGRKVLLTSDYHIFRAWRTFRKAGLDVAPLTFPDIRKRATRLDGRWPGFLELLEESAKIGYYYARGWM